MCGQGGEVYVDGLLHVVDSHGGKLPLGSHHGDVGLVHATLRGVGVAILVSGVANLDGVSVGDADGVGALGDDHLGEGVAATSVGRPGILPQAQRVGPVVGVTAHALVPVDVLVIGARCGVGLQLVVVGRIVGHLEVGALDLRVREFHEILAVAVAGRLGIGEPLLCRMAVDVVRPIYLGLVEGKEAIVLGRLCGCGECVGVHVVAVLHRVHVLGLAAVGHRDRGLHLIGPCHGRQQQQE